MTTAPWETPPETRSNFLSLGAGVQSSALALMAATGEIGPRLDAAIFADTQSEPASVYRWLDWLEGEIARSPYPFPVHRVTRGSLKERMLDMRVTADGRVFAKTDIPFFTLAEDGSRGMVPNRACTADFKIHPIRKAVRDLAGIKRGQTEPTVTQWIGISWDEIQRCKANRDPWATNRWPLVERNLTRAQCIEWMMRRGHPSPPRSSCVFCPFHSDAEWRRLRDEEPEAFAEAVAFERNVQQVKASTGNFRSQPFLHRSCKPLDQVDLSTAEERGQLTLGFDNECEGMCGV